MLVGLICAHVSPAGSALSSFEADHMNPGGCCDDTCPFAAGFAEAWIPYVLSALKLTSPFCGEPQNQLQNPQNQRGADFFIETGAATGGGMRSLATALMTAVLHASVSATLLVNIPPSQALKLTRFCGDHKIRAGLIFPFCGDRPSLQNEMSQPICHRDAAATGGGIPYVLSAHTDIPWIPYVLSALTLTRFCGERGDRRMYAQPDDSRTPSPCLLIPYIQAFRYACLPSRFLRSFFLVRTHVRVLSAQPDAQPDDSRTPSPCLLRSEPFPPPSPPPPTSLSLSGLGVGIDKSNESDYGAIPIFAPFPKVKSLNTIPDSASSHASQALPRQLQQQHV
jgi:hypothetical protein